MITYMGIDCSTLAVHTAIINKKEKLLKLEKSLGKGKTFEERFPEITTNFSDFVSNATKVDIKNFSIDIWGDIFKEQDFADASCIAKWAKGEII